MRLGGQRVGVKRPRVRNGEGQADLPLATYAHFADCDPLTAVVRGRLDAPLSRTQEPVGAEVEQAAGSTSRSSVSRAFVERTRAAIGD